MDSGNSRVHFGDLPATLQKRMLAPAFRKNVFSLEQLTFADEYANITNSYKTTFVT